MSSEPQKYNVVVTRVFDAPIEQVWKAWSDPKYVMQWWGPTGFTCPVANMDFREGGTSLICMRAPAEFGGQDLYNTWTYTKLVPMQQIEFTNNFADKDGNQINPADVGLPAEIPFEVPHVIIFKALNDNRTELTVTEYGYPSQQIVEMSKAGMEQCLDKMAAILR
jgi:uncharacterized protein YndB with AHSA1/START domain